VQSLVWKSTVELITGRKGTLLNGRTTDGSGYASSYDHMFSGPGTVEYVENSCTTLDVTKLVFGDNEAVNMRKARRELSDHLPVFAVFDVSGADDD